MPLFCHVTTFFRGFKTFFRPFEPQFGLKIRGSWAPQARSLDPPLTYDHEVNPWGLETSENVVKRGQGSTREPDTKREVFSGSDLNDARVEVLWLYNKEKKKERKKKKKPAGVPPQSPSRGACTLQDKTESENS